MSERLLGYANRISLQPGERIDFMVSSPFPGRFRAELVRLRCGDDQPGGPGFKTTRIPSELDGEYPARRQPIHAGSYVQVPDAAAFQLESLTLRTLVWPTTPERGWQCLLGNWDDARGAGYALAIGADGAATLRLGDGAGRQQILSSGSPLRERVWTLAAATVDTARGEIRVLQAPLAGDFPADTAAERSALLDLRVAPGATFRMAAWHGAEGPAAHYNGKLEAPRVASRALSPQELAEGDEATPPPVWDVAAWDLSREISSTRVVDTAPGRRDGETQNLPTRAVRGAAWDGSEHRWIHKPHHYAAIHFHDDDLYDCGWEVDASLEIPRDLPSGCYAAVLRQGEHEETIPFTVRPPRGTTTADLALLIPTASYIAYANWHVWTEWDFGEHATGNFTVLDPTSRYLAEHPELGASLYDAHTDGSGVSIASRLRPIPNMRPKEALWQFNADTHIVDWLEEKGFAYDVITDDDLHEEGLSLLAPYRCVMTGTHPEYTSRAMLEALQDYKAQGGRLLYTGANGFYWKVNYHPDLPGAIEMRRAEDGSRGWIAEPGEYYHSFTGELGGLWRRSGIPPQRVVGTGFTAQGFDMAAPYHRRPESFDPRAAFLFAGVGADEVVGDFGLLGGGAAGWEIDRADRALGTPAHALTVARADAFSAAYHWATEESFHAHSAIDGETCPWVRADMVFFETPAGGAVLATGSIAWSASLCHNGYDNNVSRITENALRRFLDPTPFPFPKELRTGAEPPPR